MPDEPCESEKDESAKVSITGNSPNTGMEKMRLHIQHWQAGEPARLEELKNSPLTQQWRKLDKNRKADGYQAYNFNRRDAYRQRIWDDEGRIVARYVTGLTDVEKKERRKEADKARKAAARANMTPEQKATESEKRAARRQRKKK